jgi:hypothetical protein
MMANARLSLRCHSKMLQGTRGQQKTHPQQQYRQQQYRQQQQHKQGRQETQAEP